MANTENAELKQPAQVRWSAWLDIGSAPKDKRIMLCLGGTDWSIGSWNPHAFDGPRWEDDGLQPMPFLIEPTHWMPLPQLPNGDV